MLEALRAIQSGLEALEIAPTRRNVEILGLVYQALDRISVDVNSLLEMNNGEKEETNG